MASNKSRYVLPRRIGKQDAPRKGTSSELQWVRREFLKGYGGYIDELARLEPQVERRRNAAERKLAQASAAIIAKARRSGKFPLWADRLKLEGQLHKELHSAPAKDLQYLYMQRTIDASSISALKRYPHLESVSPSGVRPGSYVQLWGTCFGPPQGKVLLEVMSGVLVELEVDEWTETRVTASLSPLISSVGSYSGRIWLRRADGARSLSRPMQFYPIYSYYLGNFDRDVYGGAVGKSIDDVAYPGEYLPADWTIHYMDVHSTGDGWSEARAPFAGGNSLAQGYHIGVEWYHTCHFEIWYHVLGPRGITPPDEGPPWWYTGYDE